MGVWVCVCVRIDPKKKERNSVDIVGLHLISWSDPLSTLLSLTNLQDGEPVQVLTGQEIVAGAGHLDYQH